MARRRSYHVRTKRRTGVRIVAWVAAVLALLAVFFLYVLPTHIIPCYLVKEPDGLHVKIWFVDELVATCPPTDNAVP